ncbi:MAG: apolipoprotein N-acyltransferase [Actinomycetota bacterium]|jgi:apolipoprotein N-acyltransferase
MGLGVQAVLAGVLLWSGFAPIELPIGPFIGLFLLIRGLINNPLKVRLFFSLITGFSFFLPLLHWSSSYVGWIPWVSLATLQSLIFAVIALYPFRKNVDSIFLFAACVTMIEIVRMKWPFGGFGWGRVGHTQIEWLSGLYPIIGVSGITFLAAFLAGAFSLSKMKSSIFLPIPILLAAFMPVPAVTGVLSVSAVQGGVDALGFEYNQRALSVLKRHADFSLAIPSTTSLIVWPENASDIDPFDNVQAKTIIAEYIKRVNAPVLVGAVLQSDLGPKNVSILYQADGAIGSVYTKQDLAPFGEYMPIRKIAEFISAEAKRVKDFQPGREWISHEIEGKSFQSIICFEVLDDDFLRQGLNEQEFVVAQTNNATFGRSPQAAQQLQIIRARAAEFQRDFAVVSTTGYTAHVNARGEIQAELEQFKPGVLEMEIETRDENSLATRLGSSFWIGFFALILAINLRSVYRR